MASQRLSAFNTSQINHEFYAGQSDYPSIQSAVTVAVSQGGGIVVLQPDTTVTDTINGVTGGAATVQISDKRVTPNVLYAWSGSQYVAVSTGATPAGPDYSIQSKTPGANTFHGDSSFTRDADSNVLITGVDLNFTNVDGSQSATLNVDDGGILQSSAEVESPMFHGGLMTGDAPPTATVSNSGVSLQDPNGVSVQLATTNGTASFARGAATIDANGLFRTKAGVTFTGTGGTFTGAITADADGSTLDVSAGLKATGLLTTLTGLALRTSAGVGTWQMTTANGGTASIAGNLAIVGIVNGNPSFSVAGTTQLAGTVTLLNTSTSTSIQNLQILNPAQVSGTVNFQMGVGSSGGNTVGVLQFIAFSATDPTNNLFIGIQTQASTTRGMRITDPTVNHTLLTIDGGTVVNDLFSVQTMSMGTQVHGAGSATLTSSPMVHIVQPAGSSGLWTLPITGTTENPSLQNVVLIVKNIGTDAGLVNPGSGWTIDGSSSAVSLAVNAAMRLICYDFANKKWATI